MCGNIRWQRTFFRKLSFAKLSPLVFILQSDTRHELLRFFKRPPGQFCQSIPALEFDFVGKVCEVDEFGKALVDVELHAATAPALFSLGHAAEVFDDAVIIGGKGAEGGEDFFEGGGLEDVVGGGVGVVEDRDDDVAELFVRCGAQGAADGLHDVHGAAAGIGEEHAVDAGDIDAFGEAAGVGDEGAFGAGELADHAGAGAGGGFAGDVEGFEFALAAEGFAEGVVVGLEEFRALDAAVKRDGMLDRVFLHRLPKGDEGGEHVGFDFLVPRAFVGADKGVFPDQLRDFLARDGDADDLVIG